MLLLISDLDLSQEEILVLDNLYKDARARGDTQYEMVWIPIVDKATWNDMSKQKFEYLQSLMAWYSVYDPFIIEPSAIKYIKEVWNFSKTAILVALDPQGFFFLTCEGEGQISPNPYHVHSIRGGQSALWIKGH